jgi:hypothetical protein
MLYILIALVVFIVYKLTVAWIQLRELSEKIFYELDKIQFQIDKDPSNPILYCKRGSIHQMGQNFIAANLDFRTALEMIENGATVSKPEELKQRLFMNLEYTKKPLSWSKNGPKDYSNNWLMYFLIERLGAKRFNF